MGPGGRNDVQRTIDGLSTYGAQLFQRQVVYLAGTANRSDWSEPQAKKLKGFVEMYEVRFKDRDVQTRALGFFGPAPGVFTITLICTHKANVYTPPSALDTADRRRRQICSGHATTVALQVDGEEFPPLPAEP